MRIIGLVLALVLISCVSFAATEQATISVYDEYNWVGPPIVPLNPAAPSVFGTSTINPGVKAALSRYDAPSGNEIVWDPFDTSTQFNILLGEGYFLDMTTVSLANVPYNVTYTGIPDGVPDGTGKMTDMWISLPGQDDGVDAGGYHWISCPFNHSVKFSKTGTDGANILITDGSTVKTLKQATDWIIAPFQYYDGSSRNWYYSGYFYDDDDSLRPGVGYVVQTLKDNLALIIPAN